jgi:hypothetical protein
MKSFSNLLLLPLLALIALPADAATLHVGAGQAYSTINAALGAANTGDTIIIHEGIYRETCVVQNDNLTIQAAESEHVVISGLDPVSGWTQDSGEVYYATVSLGSGLDFPQVFVNNQRINPAAYPDFPNDLTHYALWGQDGITTTETGVITFPTGKPVDHWVGGVCLSIAGSSWQPNEGIITSSTADTLVCNSLDGFESKNVGVGRGYILFHRNALDAPNEFHYDAGTGRVYLWQPGGGDPGSSTVEVRTRRWGMDFNGKSNVTVQGITFYGAAVDMTWTDNCTLSECNILYGTSYYYDPRNHFESSVDLDEANDGLVTFCYIAHGWGPGYMVRHANDSWTRGKRNEISDCILENLCWNASSRGAVHLYVANNKNGDVTRNTIRNMGSEGISGYARSVPITSNYLASCMNISRDGAAIYLYGQGGDFSRSHNWIEQCFDYIAPVRGFTHDNVRGIYTDGGADYHHVHNNVIWRCTDAVNSNKEGSKGDLMLHHIRYNNNTFWDIESTMMSGWWHPGGDGDAEDMTTYNNLGNGVSAEFGGPDVPFIGTLNWTKVTSNPTTIDLLTNGTVDNWNITYNIGSDYYFEFPNQIFNNYSTNVEGTTAADLFVDPTPNDFTDFQLKAGSAAIDFGVIDDGLPATFAGSSPDAGAYEFGETWTAGAPEFGLLAVDGFESGGLSGGTGWESDWLFQGQASIVSTALHGEYGVRLLGSGGSDYAERRVNLRGTKVGTLSYWWRGFGFDNAAEAIRVSIIDGTTEHVLRVIADGEEAATDGATWSEWRLDTIDISGYTFTENVQIVRFDASALSDTGDAFYLDDVRIDDYDAVPQPLVLPTVMEITSFSVDPGTGNCQFSWSSSGGDIYYIEQAWDLSGFWWGASEGIPATPPLNTYSVQLDPGSRSFFRVTTDPPSSLMVEFSTGQGYENGPLNEQPDPPGASSNWTEETNGTWQVDAAAGTAAIDSNDLNYRHAELGTTFGSMPTATIVVDFVIAAGTVQPAGTGSISLLRSEFSSVSAGLALVHIRQIKGVDNTWNLQFHEGIGDINFTSSGNFDGEAIGLVDSGGSYTDNLSDLLRMTVTHTLTDGSTNWNAEVTFLNVNTGETISTISKAWDASTDFRDEDKHFRMATGTIGDYTDGGATRVDVHRVIMAE